MKPGDRYLRFQILQKLGRGGFGDVYLAENTEAANRLVALKVVGKGFDEDGELAQQAERFGAELQRRLRDSRVVHVYEHDFDRNGDLFIEMEYIEGVDLSALLARQTVTEQRAAEIARELCLMLENLSKFNEQIDGRPFAGIVHGDLKPKNIRIGTGGEVKVLDFGIAKAISETKTHTVNPWYSKIYASPERLDSGDVNLQSDLWSVGVLLYQMASGKLPFDAPTERLESRIRSSLGPDPLPEVPEPLVRIIFKMLARDPGRRYASPCEVVADLENFRNGLPVTAEPIDSDATRRVTAPREPETESVAADATRRSIAPRPAPAADVVARLRMLTNDKQAKGYLRLSMFGFLIFLFIFFANAEFQTWSQGDILRAELASEHTANLDEAYGKYQELAKRHRLPFTLWKVRGVLRSKLLGSARETVSEYRNSSAPIIYEKQWRQALGYLGKSLELDASDKDVLAMMRLCDAHLNRIVAGYKGQPDAARQKYLNVAEVRFREAADLQPKSPDPYLGLARLYIYDLKDLERGREALEKAQEYGHALGKREKVQLADGYLARVRMTWSESRYLAEHPQQERAYLVRARQDCSAGTDLYQQVGVFGGSVQNLRQLIRKCQDVEDRLKVIDVGGAGQ